MKVLLTSRIFDYSSLLEDSKEVSTVGIRSSQPAKKKIWGVRPGVRKIKAIVENHFQPIFDEFNSELVVLVAGMSCAHTLSLKALEELCRLYPNTKFHIRSDGGKEFDNEDVNDFFAKKGISWIKVSKPWDNPFAERGIRTIKHEYLNQVWIGNFGEFEELSKIIKSNYNECRPHQSFDNKTPAEVRIAVTGNIQEYSPPRELEKWAAFYRFILGRTKPAIC